MLESGNRWAIILCDVDSGSIKSGPSNVRDYWLSVLEKRWVNHPSPLFIDRRHGHIATRLVESYCFSAVSAGLIPLILGGDHATTYFAYSGVRQAIRRNLDLVHFDAHHDAWPSENITNYSFARHLRNQGVTIDSRGVREEWPVDMSPQEPVNQEDLVYLSIDVDVIDPELLDAVSFPIPVDKEKPSPNMEWLDEQLSNAIGKRRLAAIDIVEWVPDASSNMGISLVGDILNRVLEIPTYRHRE